MSDRDEHPQMTRRALIAGAGTAVAGTVLATVDASLGAAQQAAAPAAATPAPAVATPLAITADPTKAPGMPTSVASARAPFVAMARTPVGQLAGSSLSPIHLFTGTITPTDLQFERHHAGVPVIDPSRHEVLLHGLVDRPLAFTLDDLRTFPAVSRIHFLECSGNGRGAYRAPKPEMTAQLVDGLLCNTEWTGVPAKVLLQESGLARGARWVLAEGGDASRLARSIPIEKMLDDALIVYAQNGEPLRPAGGYPVRLFLPGWEGNTCIKWLRRLEVAAEPGMFRDETSKYTDPLPNDSARQFSFTMDAKSVITTPSPGATARKPGWLRIAGVAWSGRGTISAVDVSVDGGRTWMIGTLQDPVLPKALTRFELMWKWDGSPATLMSRAVDETGYVQPTEAEFQRVRGAGTDYHYNYIRAWALAADGTVTFAGGRTA